MAVLGVSLAAMLAFANKALYVPEDPRIDKVEEMLPRANCGACGYPGCRAFAEALVAGEMAPGQCAPNSDEDVANIAAYLGIEAGMHEKRVARLACAGGNHVAHIRARYEGIESCRAATLLSGGGKGCAWGCLGFGDCALACPFGAITMNERDLPVVDEDTCRACGECVTICPKNLFSLHSKSHRLWVACKNLERAKDAKAECEVACTGCGICAKDAPEGLVKIENNLAVIDYTKNDLASLEVIQRCPTGAIVWLDEHKPPIKGAKAKNITRTEPLPIG